MSPIQAQYWQAWDLRKVLTDRCDSPAEPAPASWYKGQMADKDPATCRPLCERRVGGWGRSGRGGGGGSGPDGNIIKAGLLVEQGACMEADSLPPGSSVHAGSHCKSCVNVDLSVQHNHNLTLHGWPEASLGFVLFIAVCLRTCMHCLSDHFVPGGPPKLSRTKVCLHDLCCICCSTSSKLQRVTSAANSIRC